MLMSTTSVLDGRPVSRYFGVVTGEAIIGANVFRDMFAAVQHIGVQSGNFETCGRVMLGMEPGTPFL